LNRRVLGVVAAILLAAVGTWILIQYVAASDDRALEDQQPVEVLIVTEAIPAGTPVTEAADSISTKLIPVSVTVPSALVTLDSVRGQVTAIDLLVGEQVTAARFADPVALEAAARSVEVPPGLLELTIALTPERSVGGTVAPGDLVAVISSFDPFTLDAVEPENSEDLNNFLNNEQGVETITLKTPNSTGVTVYKALVTRVQVANVQGENAAASSADVAPRGSLLVSLAIPPIDAEQIVFTAEYGSIWLAREHADGPESDPPIIITRANVYR